MNQFSSLYKNGLEALQNGTFLDFEMVNQQQSDVREKRILGHLRVKKMMSEGQYDLAVKELNSTKEAYGEHISLIADQACLFYALEDYWHWDAAVVHLEKIYSEIHSRLDEESRFKTGLLLAKFFEEQGLIQKSMSMLKQVKKIIPKNRLSLQARLNANLARILATYGTTDDLMIYYKDLKYLAESNLEFKIDIEIYAALILCEARFFESTKNNLIWKESYKKYLLTNASMLQEEKSHILFDLIQMKLCGVNIDISEYDSVVRNLIPHTNYEKKLLEIYSSNESSATDWMVWSSQMPLGNFLLLGMILRKQPKFEMQEDLLKQVSMLTFSFDVEDQKLWTNIYRNSSQEKLVLTLKSADRMISISSAYTSTVTDFSFNSKKTLFILIQAILVFSKENSKVSIENLTGELFNSEMDESYFHRIREQVRRINKEFTLQCLPPLLLITDGHVSMNSSYALSA